MSEPQSLSRRRLLQRLALGVPLAAIAAGRVRPAHAEGPLLSVNDPEAKAVKYVEDVAQAIGATAGTSCANCGLYQGKAGAPEGPCQLFPNRDVRANGWCTSWAPQL